MVLCYEEVKKQTKESKKISKLKLCKNRAIVLMDRFVKLVPIASDPRNYGAPEYIKYDSICRIVDCEGGVAVFGDIYNSEYKLLLTGDKAYRYIPASIIKYEEIVCSLLEITGLKKESNVGKIAAEVTAKKGGVPKEEVGYLRDAFEIYRTGEILVAELAELCPQPIRQYANQFADNLEIRIARSTVGQMKMDISGDDFVLLCGPKNYKIREDGRGAAAPWETTVSRNNEEDLFSGTIYEYRIPFKMIERIRMEYGVLSGRKRWVWNRVNGMFQVTEYATISDYVFNRGKNSQKTVNEVLFMTGFYRFEGNRPYLSSGGEEWHVRIAQMCGKQWEIMN